MSDTELTGGTSSSESVAGPSVTSDDIGALLDSSASSADASSAAAPDSPPAKSRDAGTTAPPAEPAPDAASVPGPIPFDRHQATLNNVRAEGQRALDTLKQRLSWADQYDPQEADRGVRLLRWLSTDPDGALQSLQQQRQRTQQADTPPQPDLRAEDGTPVYSATQMQQLLEYQQRQWLAQVETKLAPVQQQYEAQRQAANEQKAGREASTVIEQARKTWPAFTTLEPHIKARMLANPVVTFEQAYIAEYAQRGPQMLEDQIRGQQTTALQQKAAAVTTRPGATPSTPRDYRKIDDPRDLTEAIMHDIGAL